MFQRGDRVKVTGQLMPAELLGAKGTVRAIGGGTGELSVILDRSVNGIRNFVIWSDQLEQEGV